MTTVKLTAKEKRAIQENFETELAEKAAVEFRKALPKKLKELELMAERLGVNTSVQLSATGPIVHFSLSSESDNMYFDDMLSYETDQWVVEDLERALCQLEKSQKARAEMMTLAQSIYDNQTEMGKKALVMYFEFLRK